MNGGLPKAVATFSVSLSSANERLRLVRGDVMRLQQRSGSVLDIAEVVPDPQDDQGDPTVQHVRVRIRPASPDEPKQSFPQFDSVPPLPGMAPKKAKWRAWFAGRSKTEGEAS